MLSSPNVGDVDFASENGRVLSTNTVERWQSSFEECLANKEQIRARMKHVDTYLSYQHIITELESSAQQHYHNNPNSLIK